ncbi:MAG TPA: YCF48-related protein [Ignavibacteria bacterium]|nr:hypothetical protein [Bacteroidota bacterium]HRE12548.1 YCF48-related protein [Ignavibacteria bacterium]HRF65288.1 YCF48-related protein [Ignavibacteria bacterium]HRJ05190.1 YCF48-related protein [Ignavibacteria bacterium]
MKIHKKVILLLLFVAHASFAQWVQISTIGTNELRGVYFFDEYTGIVVGQGGIWRSTNSGINWNNVSNFSVMNALSILGGNLVLAAGNNGIIMKSTDAGVTWIFAETSVNVNLLAIDWGNATVCYCVGASGTLLKSTNSGNNWYAQNSIQSEDLKGVYMPDPLNGYIAGGTSKELFGATFNGGTNWTYPLNQTGNYVNGMYCFPSFMKIILVGPNGRIRRSTNFGSTWSITTNITSTTLNSVYFANDNTGYIVGDNGTILKSINGGVNWVIENSSTTNSLKGIHFINTTIGWVVGSNGTVLRTGIPVAVTGNETELIRDYSLAQNYPNPFNPSTKIKFEIPVNVETTRRVVSLSIFDILGREVRTLVNENLKHGIYEADFNAADLPSGVYFYKLNAGEFTETKKMILLK